MLIQAEIQTEIQLQIRFDIFQQILTAFFGINQQIL